MQEKFLFGVIGFLLLSITGLGTYEAVKHPADTEALVPEALSAVTSAAQDATNSIAQISGEVTATNPSPTLKAQTNLTNATARRGDDDGDDNEENESEREDGSPQAASKPVPAPVSSAQPASATKTFTMAQIATHNSSSSCYSTISGKVYDLTSFINQHPGGQNAILSLCGKDGTAAFEGQHGGQRRPANELASLYIGVLAK